MSVKEWVPATGWGSVKQGEEVKLTLGGNHMVGTRTNSLTIDEISIRPQGARIANRFYRSDGWLLHVVKPTVVVPTEPGWYWDKDGDPHEIDISSDPLNPRFAPYKRMRTEAEIADALKAALTNPFTGFTGISPRVLEAINRVCGVSE